MHASYPEICAFCGQNPPLKAYTVNRINLPIPNLRSQVGAGAAIVPSLSAIAMGVYVVRAFVQLREIFASNKDLARKLVAPERSLLALDLKTQRQFKEVYEAIRALMDTPPPKQRSIGFTADLEEK